MAKILLVEDDVELAERLADWFETESYVFEAVYSGEDALQLLKSFDFDVILLDWNLPGISGIEVCKHYRAKGGQAPIIFLTGQGSIPARSEGLDSGADDYLVKPFDISKNSQLVETTSSVRSRFDNRWHKVATSYSNSMGRRGKHRSHAETVASVGIFDAPPKPGIHRQSAFEFGLAIRRCSFRRNSAHLREDSPSAIGDGGPEGIYQNAARRRLHGHCDIN
jgi:CheY-like chemotaxis protein